MFKGSRTAKTILEKRANLKDSPPDFKNYYKANVVTVEQHESSETISNTTANIIQQEKNIFTTDDVINTKTGEKTKTKTPQKNHEPHPLPQTIKFNWK